MKEATPAVSGGRRDESRGRMSGLREYQFGDRQIRSLAERRFVGDCPPLFREPLLPGIVRSRTALAHAFGFAFRAAVERPGARLTRARVISCHVHPPELDIAVADSNVCRTGEGQGATPGPTAEAEDLLRFRVQTAFSSGECEVSLRGVSSTRKVRGVRKVRGLRRVPRSLTAWKQRGPGCGYPVPIVPPSA